MPVAEQRAVYNARFGEGLMDAKSNTRGFSGGLECDSGGGPTRRQVVTCEVFVHAGTRAETCQVVCAALDPRPKLVDDCGVSEPLGPKSFRRVEVICLRGEQAAPGGDLCGIQSLGCGRNRLQILCLLFSQQVDGRQQVSAWPVADEFGYEGGGT